MAAKTTKATKAKAGNRAKLKGKGKGKGMSAYQAFKVLICKYPDKTCKELHAMLEKQGHHLTASTVAVSFYEAKGTIKALISLGLLKA